jgi:hypothetical protein
MDKGVSGAEVDEGCNRVMKDQAKWMEGKNEINRAQQARCLHHESDAK